MRGPSATEARSYLLLERDLLGPEAIPFAAGTAAVYTVRCPGGEQTNEDGLALIPFGERSGILAVADGLGGQPAGAKAAWLALESLVVSLDRARREEGHLREAILNGMELANREVQALGVGAGTTLAVVEIREHTARAYHVGDSEILIVGQRGKVRFRNVPHSPVGYGVEAGLIDRDEALDHEERHLLTNLVGSPEMRIEIGPIVRLHPRDVVLVASDGLHDNLHAGEIIATVRKGSLRRAAGALAQAASGRMTFSEEGQPSKPDDLTFLLFRRSAG